MSDLVSSRAIFWAYVAVLVTAFSWSGNWVAGRGLNEEMTPLALSFWRWVVAGLVFLPFAAPAFWRERYVIRREFWRLLVFAFIGALAFNTLVYWGLRTTGAINGAIYNSMQPIFVLLIGVLWFGQRYSLRVMAGMLVSLTGVVIIIARGDMSMLMKLSFGIGDLLILVAVLTWATYSVLLKAWPTKLSQMVFFAATIVFGLPMILPFYLADLVISDPVIVSKSVIIGTLYMAIIGSVIAYLCWNFGVRIIGAARASLILHLTPVFTAIQAIFLLDETIHMFHLAGIILIFPGIYIATVQEPFWRKWQGD
jgi:drug/metabolite transporter (DMT)-like permease